MQRVTVFERIRKGQDRGVQDNPVGAVPADYPAVGKVPGNVVVYRGFLVCDGQFLIVLCAGDGHDGCGKCCEVCQDSFHFSSGAASDGFSQLLCKNCSNDFRKYSLTWLTGMYSRPPAALA